MPEAVATARDRLVLKRLRGTPLAPWHYLAGRTSSVLAYESIGLTVNRLGLPERVPTLIGTLSLPRADGTMFLVATVRPAGPAGGK